MAIPKQQRERLINPLEYGSPGTVPSLQFELERPTHLSGRELDDYLDAGWYRQGQGLFTTYSTISRKILMAAPWIRVETDKYTLSKNLRRLKSRNDSRLTYHIGKAMVTPYREELFQKFRTYFKGEFYESLSSALYCYRSQPDSIFDSREITFYLDGEMIGFSYFDVGENSIASILNIYSDEHMKYSLGMYAILLQLEWCVENGKKYYYPGYAMPENPRFDYKLRIGGIDFLDQKSRQWKPWNEFQLDETPLYEYREAMVKARDRFFGLDLGWRIGVYLNHSNPCPLLIDQSGAEFLSHPIFLSGDISDETNPLVVDYDLKEKVYRLFRCSAYHRQPYPENYQKHEDVLFPVDFDCADFGCVALLTLDKLLLKSADLLEIYEEIRLNEYEPWLDDLIR
ncbi:MAG: hypothetical protein P1U89_03445 [Verrucomicrobiales bacterium]|nr:hypothetical protein [Verrucomicrobiales bacterium]